MVIQDFVSVVYGVSFHSEKIKNSRNFSDEAGVSEHRSRSQDHVETMRLLWPCSCSWGRVTQPTDHQLVVIFANCNSDINVSTQKHFLSKQFQKNKYSENFKGWEHFLSYNLFFLYVLVFEKKNIKMKL